MLQKVKEKSRSLSPRTICMPAAFNQTINGGEGNKSCRIDLKDSLLAERSSQLKQRANYHGWDSQETYAFKLSISRLPKWAQDKVTSSDFVQRNLEFTSPQVFLMVDFDMLICIRTSKVKKQRKKKWFSRPSFIRLIVFPPHFFCCHSKCNQ